MPGPEHATRGGWTHIDLLCGGHHLRYARSLLLLAYGPNLHRCSHFGENARCVELMEFLRSVDAGSVEGDLI